MCAFVQLPRPSGLELYGVPVIAVAIVRILPTSIPIKYP
jgi:hypothetical protein